MKEKDIQNAIVKYLLSIWARCESLQSWSILSKKWPLTYKINLCTPWTPDIVALYKDIFYAIEVKKDEEATNKWIKLENRILSWETLAKSNLREKNQIEHKHKIMKNWWVHIITHDINEIKDYFSKL